MQDCVTNPTSLPVSMIDLPILYAVEAPLAMTRRIGSPSAPPRHSGAGKISRKRAREPVVSEMERWETVEG